MTAKEKAIQEAYGSAWEKVKEHTDKDGWTRPESIFVFKGDIHPHPHKEGYFRPDCIKGIEDNNGWITYDDHRPKIDQRIFYCLEGVPSPVPCDYHPEMPMCSLMTHWKPADPPKPPIY